MACPDNTGCNDCGCLYPSNSECLTYKGLALPCLDVVQGDTLTEILGKIDSAICGAITVSGDVYTASSCDSNIVITATTIGNTTNFESCLSDTITTNISNNTTNISTLFGCLTNTVKDIVSNDGSIIISVDSSNGCGRTLNITTSAPSGEVQYDGIVYNDLTKSGTSGAVGATETLKTFTKDYITDNLLTTGDEVRFVIAGQIDPSALGTDTVIVELYNVNTASVIDSSSYSSWLGSVGKLSSFVFNGVISLASTTAGRYTLVLDTNNADNTGFSVCNNSVMKGYDVANYDFSALRINVKFLTTSGSSSGNNYVHKLMVEVRKKI